MKKQSINKTIWMVIVVFFTMHLAGLSQAQGDNNPSVRYAVLYEGVDAVRQAIEAGADINELDENGYSPLIWACSYSSKEFYRESAKLLIEKGADVTIKANDGTTALIEAANDSREVFDLLLAKGASMDDKKNDGTGCFYECMLGILFYGLPNYDLAEFLISKGADVDEAPVSGELKGYATLIFAAREGNKEAVKFLLDHGADPNAENEQGDTPLALAEKQGHAEVVAMLKAHGAK